MLCWAAADHILTQCIVGLLLAEAKRRSVAKAALHTTGILNSISPTSLGLLLSQKHSLTDWRCIAYA
jgi:hypothetical protein